MSVQITDIAALERCIGKTPGPMHLKVIDHLDAGAQRWLAVSPLMFAAFGSPDGVGVSLGGGEPGFASVLDTARIRLPIACLDSPGLAYEGHAAGMLFVIPTIGEALRVNGRIAAVDAGAIEIAVEECFVHCAKALIRSDFWKASPLAEVPAAPAAYLLASRFLVLATVDAAGRADISPKGDPAGSLIRLVEGVAWFAERPGNRRADSFRNLLSQPRVALAALIPGATRIALVHSAASLTTDDEVRAAFAVHGKTPLLATRLSAPVIELRDSPTLERAGLWPARPPAEAIDAAAMIVTHMKVNNQRGLQAALVRGALSIPGLMQKGLAADYKRNLY